MLVRAQDRVYVCVRVCVRERVCVRVSEREKEEKSFLGEGGGWTVRPPEDI